MCQEGSAVHGGGYSPQIFTSCFFPTFQWLKILYGALLIWDPAKCAFHSILFRGPFPGNNQIQLDLHRGCISKNKSHTWPDLPVWQQFLEFFSFSLSPPSKAALPTGLPHSRSLSDVTLMRGCSRAFARVTRPAHLLEFAKSTVSGQEFSVQLLACQDHSTSYYSVVFVFLLESTLTPTL